MKQCPQCSATFNDDMSFCLNDGTSLVSPRGSEIPATVMFIPQQSSQTGQIEQPAPTMFSNTPQQSYQQPQFGQPPPFNQQKWGTSAPPSHKKSIVGIIVVVVLLFFGLVGIVGGLMIYKYSRSKSEVYTYNTPSSYSSPNSSNSPTIDNQDTAQGGSKNGFTRISIEDVTSRKFFPTANKTSAATYENGSERVVSFLSVYNSSAEAEAAFLKYLDQVKSEGKTISKRQDNYAYYSKGDSYSTAFWVKNKLYEYSCNNQQTLYRFAK